MTAQTNHTIDFSSWHGGYGRGARGIGVHFPLSGTTTSSFLSLTKVMENVEETPTAKRCFCVWERTTSHRHVFVRARNRDEAVDIAEGVPEGLFEYQQDDRWELDEVTEHNASEDGISEDFIYDGQDG